MHVLGIDLSPYKPAVTKGVRLLLAGGLWGCVGVLLLVMAFSWLKDAAVDQRLLCGVAGVLFGLLMYHRIFSRIVDKNLARMLPDEERRCLFSFMPWKSYALIPVMILLGTLLRHSKLPRPYLAILYMGIGLALLLSSIRYARHFVLHKT